MSANTRRAALLFAFAFAVMADPVSSVAYAIEAALRALDGNLAMLLPTMALVVAIVAVLVVNYHQIVGRYPQGGGAAAAAADAFGEASAFIPVGALIVDFVLTIAISCAAAASAVIAFFPNLADLRPLIALLLVTGVAAVTWFGHRGRVVFAVMTVVFVALTVVVLICGLFVTPLPGPPVNAAPGHGPPLAVALAFPVAMALATGIEAPSSAIAQLGQLDDPGRRRFGRITLWLTLIIVGTLTLALTAELVHLRIGVPPADSTQIAELARIATAPPVFAAFQLATALLLLSAASSSFQAGPGLLKALARRRDPDGTRAGILPAWLGRTNSGYTPYWGVVVFMLAAGAVTLAARGRDQELVLFYAAAVFVAFHAGLVSMCRFSWQQRRFGSLAINLTGTAAVSFTLVINVTRGEPIVSIASAVLIAAGLYVLWIRAGRPRGIGHSESAPIPKATATR
ncbi:amino acid permease [Mycolicibacterium pyrenivorans]|uniref:amino acid permease n=1 Tax=Mycolicibacterium pyrenivorans TaxID=187102 RepID=UPI0021F37B4A|nr:amino acid permease [Mycolicibacterium pyrenivorans]MCV7151892.1 amino acid permease [Mycolicibacterium pyrenivorans]